MKLIHSLIRRQETYPQYRAPRENGAKLVAPAAEKIVSTLRTSAAEEFPFSSYDFCGRTHRDLRDCARSECYELARHYTNGYVDVATPDNLPGPLIVTGHQPSLVHPGVWLKNFAAGQLAAETEAIALSLVIDNDVCPAPSIRVPTGSIDAPQLATVPFDAPTRALPYEERPLIDRSLWNSFGRRVREQLGGLVEQPIVDSWWPGVADLAETQPLIGLQLAQARHRTELAWGSRSLELPQSLVCQSEAFRWFACTLLARLPEFLGAYNESLADYRAAHHLKNAAQPMPDLATEGDWLEAPFWLWSTAAPERRPLFACRCEGELLITDRADFQQALPLGANDDLSDAVATIAAWENRGVKLRSRALTTTMFARLFFADLFLHGIGGGKYDQVTDSLCEKFFDSRPAPFAVLSGTLHLPIEHPRGGDKDVRREAALLRDLKFHPEKHLSAPQLTVEESRAALAAKEQKQRAIETAKTVENAGERHQRIAGANRILRELVATERESAFERLEAAKRRAKANLLLESREYAFCLFPRDTLQKFLLDFRAELA